MVYTNFYGDRVPTVEEMVADTDTTNGWFTHYHTLRAHRWTLSIQWMFAAPLTETWLHWTLIIVSLLVMDRIIAYLEKKLYAVYCWCGGITPRVSEDASLTQDASLTDARRPSFVVRTLKRTCAIAVVCLVGILIQIRRIPGMSYIHGWISAVWRRWAPPRSRVSPPSSTTLASSTSDTTVATTVSTTTNAQSANSSWLWWCYDDGICNKVSANSVPTTTTSVIPTTESAPAVHAPSVVITTVAPSPLDIAVHNGPSVVISATAQAPTVSVYMTRDFSGVQSNMMVQPVEKIVVLSGARDSNTDLLYKQRDNRYHALYADLDRTLGFSNPDAVTTWESAPRHAAYAALLGTSPPGIRTIVPNMTLPEGAASTQTKPTGFLSRLLQKISKNPFTATLPRLKSSHVGRANFGAPLIVDAISSPTSRVASPAATTTTTSTYTPRLSLDAISPKDAVNLHKECATVAHLVGASEAYETVCQRIRPFDAIFSRGASIISDVITTIQGVVRDNCKLFSHVGYLINTTVYQADGMVPGEWYVVESVYSGLSNYDSTLNIAGQSFSGVQIRSLREQMHAPENKGAFYFVAFLNDAARERVSKTHARRLEYVISMYLGASYPVNPFNFVPGFFDSTKSANTDAANHAAYAYNACDASANVATASCDPTQAARSLASALKLHENAPVDYRDAIRALGSKPETKFFCSELVCRTYQQLGIVDPQKTDFRYVYPVDFFDPSVMDVVFDRLVHIVYVPRTTT